MEFWIVWLIGIVVVIATRIAINICQRDTYTYEKSKIARIIINLLIIICIVIVGGIPIGKYIGTNFDYWYTTITPITIEKIIAIIFLFCFIICIVIGVYLIGYGILGLYHFSKLHWLHIVVYIVSTIVWSIVVCQYNRNIETITQTVVESEERRELLYFCNIPVQNTSGTISRSRGTIQTTDNLTYWYLNENGEGTFDSALAENSNIVFLEENQSPYVEIVVYSTKIISKNHNNGTEETITEKTWAEYKFYLPKTIMQYNLE